MLTTENVNRLIEVYGEEISLDIVVEEFSELIKEACKVSRNQIRKGNLLEEMADVMICTKMLRTMTGITNEELAKEIDRKMKRNLERANIMDEKIKRLTKELREIKTRGGKYPMLQLIDNCRKENIPMPTMLKHIYKEMLMDVLQ